MEKRIFNFLILPAMILLVSLLLMGCASLGKLVSDFPTPEEAQPQIVAVSSITEDMVKDPYTSMVNIGIGYGLALLRRWYKKKKGSQG